MIKTKKYKLDSKMYLSLALSNVMAETWWAFLVPGVILLLPLLYQPALWWCVSIAVLLAILYPLFWLAQFAGFTQMEQAKPLFEKLSYTIDSRQIMIMLSPQQGMPINWDMVTKVKHTSEHTILFMSKVQFIYLPRTIFRSDNDVRLLERILGRKGLFEEVKKEEKE